MPEFHGKHLLILLIKFRSEDCWNHLACCWLGLDCGVGLLFFGVQLKKWAAEDTGTEPEWSVEPAVEHALTMPLD